MAILVMTRAARKVTQFLAATRLQQFCKRRMAWHVMRTKLQSLVCQRQIRIDFINWAMTKLQASLRAYTARKQARQLAQQRQNEDAWTEKIDLSSRYGWGEGALI